MKTSLEFKNITKVFPGVVALDDVSFKIESGEIIAFLGENGAGKSTLLKILNGDYEPTSGEYLINNEKMFFKNPHEAIKNGISIIYQERQILLELSVAENIFIGNLFKNKFGLVDYKKLNFETQKLIDEFNLDIRANEIVKNLSTAHQQMIEIIKAYNRNSRIIAFDEPTASLSDKETTALFQIIKKLKSEGKIIIYVSHRMKELDELADKIIIFKDGKVVDCVIKGSISNRELIKKMVGRDLGDIFNSLEKGNTRVENILELKNISTSKVKNISFKLKKGEILGFSGLVGAGRTEVMNALFGIDKILSGEIYFKDEIIEIRSPKDAIKIGIGLCPEDRKLEGIFPILSVEQNMSIPMLEFLANSFGFINIKDEKNLTESYIEELKIKTSSKDKKIVELSGGNQQKVILARWLALNPKILILDEPTKGIDIGAKSEFYNLICLCAKAGMGIIVISSELPEILGITDRILVMKDGEIVKEYITKEATEELLLGSAIA